LQQGRLISRLEHNSLLLLILFTVLAIKDFRIDKYMPSKEQRTWFLPVKVKLKVTQE